MGRNVPPPDAASFSEFTGLPLRSTPAPPPRPLPAHSRTRRVERGGVAYIGSITEMVRAGCLTMNESRAILDLPPAPPAPRRKPGVKHSLMIPPPLPCPKPNTEPAPEFVGGIGWGADVRERYTLAPVPLWRRAWPWVAVVLAGSAAVATGMVIL